MNHDIHNYKRRLELVTKTIRQSDSIPKENRKAILRFKDHSFAEGLSVSRIVRYMWDLKTLSGWLGIEFQRARKRHIKSLVAKIEKSKYADLTKRDFKITLRKFFMYLKRTDGYPEEVAWYKTHVRNSNRKLPEEILTPEEVMKMIRAANNPRDRAFVCTLYDSGCRIGEILTLRLKHVVPANPGFQLIVNGKTGYRRIRIIASEPHLSEWINIHPCAGDPEAPLWVTKKGEAVGYATFKAVLKIIKAKTGIKKRIYPQIFRHSRATHLANHLTEAQMKQYFGWIQGSKMASIYVHLSGRDVDNAILELYGIKDNRDAKEDTTLQPRNCDRCKETNPPTSEYCKRCGMPLTKQAITKIMEKDLIKRRADNLLDELMKDEEFKEMFGKKINALLKKKSS